jgi:hypothetical protein
LNSSADRAKFTRELYNLRHVLECEEADDGYEAMIQRLKDRIEDHNLKHPMGSLNTRKEDAEDSRKSKRNGLTVMPAQVGVLEPKMQQTARSSQRTVMRWNRERLWMKRETL